MTFILFPSRQLPYLRRFRKKWTIVEEKSLFVFHYMRLRLPSFTLPITLSYTTGGIKVGELNGAVALGWRLEAEPIITREIRGLPDELSFLRDSTYMKTNNALFYSQVGQGIKDLQCDIFHYRTLSSSGKFILNMTDKLAFHPNVLTERSCTVDCSWRMCYRVFPE